MDYQYPIDVDWSQEEMIQVVTFFNAIESFYESSIERDTFMIRYHSFKRVIPGKADEKNIFEEFKKQSGYDSYKAVKQAKNNPNIKTLSDN